MAKNVIIYSTPGCPWCIRAKQFLKENNIVFLEWDVSIDKIAADEMVKKSGQMGVPVLDIGGKIVIGFDAEEIDKALEAMKQKETKVIA